MAARLTRLAALACASVSALLGLFRQRQNDWNGADSANGRTPAKQRPFWPERPLSYSDRFVRENQADDVAALLVRDFPAD